MVTSKEKDHKYIHSIIEKYCDDAYFVELTGSLEVRLKRNELADRLEEKPSKKNLEFSKNLILEYEKTHTFNTNGDFPYGDHLIIDTEKNSPDESAELIINHYNLKRI